MLIKDSAAINSMAAARKSLYKTFLPLKRFVFYTQWKAIHSEALFGLLLNRIIENANQCFEISP
jgi:hypothetical protein